MRKISLLKRLEQYPLFTENDVAKIVNKGSAYVRKLLYRMCKEGLITRLEKGKYTVYADPLIFASYLSIPSYLSLWTAFRYYNMTQQQPYRIFVISSVPKKPLEIQNAEIIFKKSKHMFGYKKERYADFDIFMAEPEKAIIDAFLFKIPISDIVKALDEYKFNFEKLSAYAKKTGNISLMKRLGYILEKKKRNSYGLGPKDSNYVLLDYLGVKKGKKNAKWKLIINCEI